MRGVPVVLTRHAAFRHFGKVGWPSSSSVLNAACVTDEQKDKLIDTLQDWKTAHYEELIKSGQVETRPGVLRLMDEARAAGLKVAVCSAATKSAAVVTVSSLLGKQRWDALDCFLAGNDVAKLKVRACSAPPHLPHSRTRLAARPAHLQHCVRQAWPAAQRLHCDRGQHGRSEGGNCRRNALHHHLHVHRQGRAVCGGCVRGERPELGGCHRAAAAGGARVQLPVR